MNKYFVYVTDTDGKQFTLECRAQNMQEAEEFFAKKEVRDPQGRPYILEKIFSARNKHVCKYCGSVAETTNQDLLCDDCREVFGHAFFHEL